MSGGRLQMTKVYRPELDWLRFFAFLAVFLHHALPQDAEAWAALVGSRALGEWAAGAVRSGAFGVDLFLSLSAYLITDLMLREREATGGVHIARFYARRALRIWPLYYVFLFLAVVPVRYLLPGHELEHDRLLPFLLFFGNWDVALRGYPGSVADPLWSISIEEQFYLAWPLVVVFAGHRLRSVCALLLIVGSVSRLLLILDGASHPGIWCNSFARVDPIALGALLATSRLEIQWTWTQRIASGVTGGTLLITAGYLDGWDGPLAMVTYPIVAIASALLLVAFHGVPASASSIARALAYLGRISYGLYVFHLLAIVLVRNLELAASARVLLSLACTIGLATLSYQFLERPFLRLKERYSVIHSRPV